jgi:hypothetical protein
MVLLLIACGTVSATAQSIVDARRIEFTPSPDHSVLDANGVALVTNYSLQVFVAGGTTAAQTVSLGKPAPDPDGMIRLDFVALLPTPLTPGVVYEALVEAVGPGGGSGGIRSNTFSFTPPCTPSISPTSQSVAAAGGPGSSSVTVGAGCTWTAASNATWIAITAGASGSGSANVSFNIAANTATSVRTGTLTIAGVTFTVTQAAAACSFTVAPLALTPAGTATAGTIAVTAQAGCTWAASSPVTWVTVTGSGSGNGSVSYSVAANTTTLSRSTTLTVAGKTVSVTQAARVKPTPPTNVRIIR